MGLGHDFLGFFAASGCDIPGFRHGWLRFSRISNSLVRIIPVFGTQGARWVLAMTFPEFDLGTASTFPDFQTPGHDFPGSRFLGALMGFGWFCAVPHGSCIEWCGGWSSSV